MVGAVAVITAAMLASPALSQTPPPSPAPGAYVPNGPYGDQTSVSASTDQVNGTVDYSAQDGVTINNTGVHQGGGRRCIAETPAQAGVTYGNGLAGTGMDTFVPGVNGTNLPLVGTIPANAAADPVLEGQEYIVVCDGVPTGFGIWAPGPTTVAATPQQIANQVSGQIPMPSVSVGINPPDGFAGLEAWFWVSGYSGAPITVTPPALGHTLVVSATPTSYTWDFGDGTAPYTTASLGQPYPQQSDIRHTYAAMNPAYQVTVIFNFNVRYQVDGGAWINLPPIQRTATATYQVGQVRTYIVSRG